MGAVTVANVKVTSPVEQYRVVQADVTFSNSYATGGDTLSLGLLGLKAVFSAHAHIGTTVQGTTGASGGFAPTVHGLQVVLAGTPIAPLLKVNLGAAGSPAQVASTTDLSANPSVRLEFRGV